jgi:O-antigen ligase
MTQKITEKLIGITIFLLPAYLIRLSIFGISTNVLEIFILLSFVAYLGEGKFTFYEFYKKHRSIFWPIVAIFLGLLGSVAINHYYQAGAGIIKSWFVLPLAFAWVAYTEVKSGKNVEAIFKWLYLSTFVVAIASLAYYSVGWLTFDGRLQGIFNSPNYLAMYLAPGIIIAFSQAQTAAREAKNRTSLFLLAVSLAIICISFYLTYSYAAWAAVIASLLITAFIKNKKKINLKKTAVVVAAVLLVFLSQWNSQKFRDFRMLSERSSLESRIMIWSAAEKIISDNLFWGIGPGNFQNKYLGYQKYFPPYLEWAVPHPHNLYLTFWLSGGILSLAGFLALLFFWFWEAIKKEKNSLWAISFAIMLYFLLHGLVDTTYFKNDLAVVFWLNLLMLL